MTPSYRRWEEELYKLAGIDETFLAEYAPIPIQHDGRTYVAEPHMLGGIGTVPLYWERTREMPLVWGIFPAHPDWRDDLLHSFNREIEYPPTERERTVVERAARAWLRKHAKDI